MEAGHEPHEIVETSGLTSIMGNYVFTTSGVRVTSHELYQRQGDGTYRLVVELFGFRDPLR